MIIETRGIIKDEKEEVLMVILARCMVEDNCELEVSLGYGETTSHPKKKKTKTKTNSTLFSHFTLG